MVFYIIFGILKLLISGENHIKIKQSLFACTKFSNALITAPFAGMA